MAYYSLPELPYDYAALEPHLSARILELHHDKHHKAYVDGANKVLARLGEARSSGDYGSINQLEKNLAFHLSARKVRACHRAFHLCESSVPKNRPRNCAPHQSHLCDGVS